ncbi:hypothetical protein GCM10027360_92780 [Amycolatopsis echigonensis]
MVSAADPAVQGRAADAEVAGQVSHVDAVSGEEPGAGKTEGRDGVGSRGAGGQWRVDG